MTRIMTILASTAATIIVALIMTLMSVITVDRRHLAAERAVATAATLAASNLAAERDSTRDAAVTHGALAALLGDSLLMAERQVVQVEQRADALDRALGAERRGAYLIEVAVDSLRAVARAAPVVDSAVRRATFDVRRTPYTVHADVAIPTPPDPARLAIAVSSDPVRLEARVSCSAPDALGVRTASIDAAAPAWASVSFGRVEQAPEVCAPPPVRAAGRPVLDFRRLLLGGGWVRTKGGWTLGAFVGAGVGIGY